MGGLTGIRGSWGYCICKGVFKNRKLRMKRNFYKEDPHNLFLYIVNISTNQIFYVKCSKVQSVTIIT